MSGQATTQKQSRAVAPAHGAFRKLAPAAPPGPAAPQAAAQAPQLTGSAQTLPGATQRRSQSPTEKIAQCAATKAAKAFKAAWIRWKKHN